MTSIPPNPYLYYKRCWQLAQNSPWPVSKLPPTFNEAVKMYRVEYRFAYIVMQYCAPSLFRIMERDLSQSHLYVAMCAWWSPPPELNVNYDWYDPELNKLTLGLAWQHPLPFHIATLDMLWMARLPLGADYALIETKTAQMCAAKLFN